MIPKDPVMLLSFVNTQLRDNYSSLSDLAASYGVSEQEIKEKIGSIGYTYNEEQNRFVNG
ncbi:MAG: DUF4250 domain-containing protein [Lachnospiraceae bacterium]|nr:DUF4250 domain-containing protein [Lachnospiraceae bacterium]